VFDFDKFDKQDYFQMLSLPVFLILEFHLKMKVTMLQIQVKVNQIIVHIQQAYVMKIYKDQTMHIFHRNNLDVWNISKDQYR
jgi:hypothetical protein